MPTTARWQLYRVTFSTVDPRRRAIVGGPGGTAQPPAQDGSFGHGNGSEPSVVATPYPKLARLVHAAGADADLGWLPRSARVVADPPGPPPVRSNDPADDHLITLAAAERAVLVSGDAALTSLAHLIPVRTPAAFLAELEG